jgi:hypothetical protein
MYLQALAGHDNLIRLQHVIKAENGRDIYLTFDHMGMLQFIFPSSNRFLMSLTYLALASSYQRQTFML